MSIESYKAYQRQVFVGTCLIFVILLVCLAVACGLAVAVVNSSQEVYRAIVFFSVLVTIVIIIGAYSIAVSVERIK